MERVAFLIEDTGERIGCLLNPESLVIRRTAGVQAKRSVNGLLTGAALQDNPILFTGGGRTVLELDLLFDISIAGSSVTTEDVRDLTGPLARLAENASGRDRYGGLPLVRFVWGKSWNIPGIVAAVAERFDRFAPTGVPERSWMRMRFLRVNENPQPEPAFGGAGGALGAERPPIDLGAIENLAVPEGSVQVHETKGGSSEGGPGERMDQLSYRYYSDPGLWRIIAIFNRILDPLHLLPGLLLRIPPLITGKKQP
jgi:hypothetical protein